MIMLTTTQLSLILAVCSNASPFLQKRDNYRMAITRDFADPCIMKGHDDKYYAYSSTDTKGHEVQVATSDDGFDWTFQEGVSALAFNADWTGDTPYTWAPDVWPAESGMYWMYYAATNKKTGKHSIGFAVGSDPMDMAPSVSYYDEPWLEDDLGVIDPCMFQDSDGLRYVLYKIDGNSDGKDTPIKIQRVGPDGHSKVGKPVEILNRDDADGPLVENPSLVLSGGKYYLTFSSNMYDGLLYDTSYAVSDSVTGPYEKVQAPDAPLLVTDDTLGLWGPGAADMIQTEDDEAIMVYHGWNSVQADDLEGSYRGLFAARIKFDDGRITFI